MDYTDFGIQPLSDVQSPQGFGGGGGGGFSGQYQMPSMDQSFNWGAQSPLSGQGGGMFGGGFDMFGQGQDQQQDDSLISLTAMNAGSPVDGPVPKPPEEPSFLKKVFSGMLIGVSGAAGAPDAATGFAQGMRSVMQFREQERQAAMQQKQLENQTKLQEAQIGKIIADRMFSDKQLATFDEDRQRAIEDSDIKRAQVYQQLYGSPERVIDRNSDAAKQVMDEEGATLLPLPLDDKILLFDPNKQLGQETTVVDPYSGEQRKLPPEFTALDQFKWEETRRNAKIEQENAAAERASREKIATITASRPLGYGPSWSQPGNVPENENLQINNFSSQLGTLNSRLDKAINNDMLPMPLVQDANGQWTPPNGMEANKVAVTAAQQANQIQQQINQMQQQKNTAIGQSGNRAIPKPNPPPGATQQKFNSQTGQWEYK